MAPVAFVAPAKVSGLGRHDLKPLILSAQESAGRLLHTLQAVVRTPAALLFVGRGYLGGVKNIVERAFHRAQQLVSDAEKKATETTNDANSRAEAQIRQAEEQANKLKAEAEDACASVADSSATSSVHNRCAI